MRYQADSSNCSLSHSDETDNSRRLCDTAARRQVRLQNPERRQLEQERAAAANQRVRLISTEKRQLDQERDTAAHRQVRLENTDRRREEQIRDTAAHQISRQNPVTYSKRTAETRPTAAQRGQIRSSIPYTRTADQQCMTSAGM